MKKHLIIAGIICAVSIPPAYAVTKCVKLRPSTTCTSFSGSYYHSNWSANCGGIGIQGVAFCGSNDGGLSGTKTEGLTVTPDDKANKYCWCKMVSPAVSLWVFSGITFEDSADCMNKCAFTCGEATNNDSNVRLGMFSEFSD